MKNKSTLKNALYIGVICAFSYLAVYISRNVLSAVSPQMITNGIVSEKVVGTMSSIFFFTYAIGQLLNGIIGDVISSKYMISVGLVLSGISSFLLPVFSNSLLTEYFLYGVMGFTLSMIYGPMTKTIAENTKPQHAIKCNLALNFSAYFGAPLAGVLALFFTWNNAFKSSGIFLLFMSFICFIIFTFFESKKIVVYSKKMM